MASKVSPPTEILTTYRQYKRDTESIAGWLADNALKCGFKLAGAATASGPRLKGKARKQAQASRSQQSHTVKVSELIGMADTIIKHKPTPHVPKVLGSLFQRAIDARRDCSHWYQHHGNGDKYSNRRHQHFTNVLQDVWEALRPFQGSQTKWTGAAEPNKKERKNNNDTASDYVNRFAGLQVQNILSPDLDGAEKSIPKVSLELPNIAPAVIEKEEDDIEADFFFAIYSFLCDVKKLRRTVQHYWSDYASGKMELTVASMLTNIVIILVRRAEQALELCIQRPNAYPASQFPVWTFPILFMCRQHQPSSETRAIGIQDFVRPPRWPADDLNENASLSMWPVYNSVKSVLSDFDEKDDPGPRCKAISAGNTWLLAPCEFKDSEKAVLLRLRELLPSFRLTAVVKISSSLGKDEISLGISKIFQSRTLPIWAIFGIQVLIDTQDILKDATSSLKPLEELQSHTFGMLGSKKLFERENNPFGKAAKDHPCSKLWVNDGLEDLRYIALDDGLRSYVRTMLVTAEEPKHIITSLDCMQEDYYYLRNHPLHCGLLKYCSIVSSHCAGICFEKQWQGLASLVHVYAACRRVHPNDPVWPDMELFLQNQNVNHLFIGGIPKSSSEAFRKLNLAFGMRDTDRYAQVRLVSNPNPLQAVLKDWIHGIKADNAEVWLLELMAVVYDPKIFRETARRAGISATEIESQLAQWSNAGSDPAQFLEVLSFYLTTNTDMYFEWHQMHACAEAIWRNLNNAIYNKRRKRYDCAPIVAFETLKEAELAEETAADAHLLNNAWESIKELCEKGLGDACIEGLVKKAGMDEMLRPCIYVAKKLDVLYMNWPQERKSSFAYKKLATIAAKNAAAGAQW